MFYLAGAVAVLVLTFPFGHPGGLAVALTITFVNAALVWGPPSLILYLATRGRSSVPRWAYGLAVAGYVLMSLLLMALLSPAGVSGVSP